MIRQPVGPLISDQEAASNCPADLHAVGTRLFQLGLLQKLDLTRAPEAFSPDSNSQKGFFNRERVIEVYDHHDWGTSWLVELVESAAGLYRDNYLAPENNAGRFRALITLNDASLPQGGASPDHFGHQTGLFVDLLLPRKDGTVRRQPQSTSAQDQLYDRPAMEEMLKAFNGSNLLARKPLFFDPAANAALFESNSVCKRFAQVQVAVPQRQAGEVPEGVSGSLAEEGNRERLAVRFRQLGYRWAGEAEIVVSRHVFEEGVPKREGQRYALSSVKTPGLEWAVRLFKAILLGRAVVDQRDVDLTLSNDELQWLYAKNAPAWVPMPVGTIEAHSRMVHSIRTFQAVVAGRETTRDSTGRIDPHDDVEQWLLAERAPKWVPLIQPGMEYDVLPIVHGHQSYFHSDVPNWTQECVELAAVKATAAGAGRLQVVHPATRYLGVSGAESGLRVRIRVTELATELRIAVAKSFQSAIEELNAGQVCKMFIGCADADVDAFRAAGVERSTRPEHVDELEVRIPAKPLQTPADPPNSHLATFVVPASAAPVPEPEQGQMREKPQKPRLAFLSSSADPGNFTGVGLQVFRSQPSQQLDTWIHTPIVFELPLKGELSAAQLPTIIGDPVAVEKGVQMVSKPDDGQVPRGRLDTTQVGIEFAGQTEWPLDLGSFNLTPPISRVGHQPFAIANARIVFEAGFKWSGDAAPPVGNCYLACDFGRGLFAKPLELKVALVGDPKGAVPCPFALSYVTAADHPQRPPRTTMPPAAGTATETEPDNSDPTPSETEQEKNDAGGNLALFEGWRFRFPIAKYPLDVPLLGNGLELTGSFDLLLGSGGELAFNLHGELATPAGDLFVPLGTSMVRLKVKAEAGPVAECDLGTLGFQVRLNKLPELTLQIDPFDGINLDGPRTAAIANAFEGGAEQGAPLISIKLPTDGLPFGDVLSVDWNVRGPRLSRSLLAPLLKGKLGTPKANNNRRLASLGGPLLGKNNGTRLLFADGSGDCSIESVGNEWRLKVPLNVLVNREGQEKPVISGNGTFVFSATLDPDAPFVSFDAKSFRCESENTLTVLEGCHTRFEELVSLHVPKGTEFQFRLDPLGPRLTWDPRPKAINGEPPVISLRIPAAEGDGNINDAGLKKKDSDPKNSRFAFDLDRFELHPAGLDLHGGVRSNAVRLGDSDQVVFADAMQVMPSEKSAAPPPKDAPPRIGEVEYRNGRLVGGSLRATARLPFFDNATGTFGLVVSEDAASGRLNCLGTFDVKGSEKFDLSALYAQCEIRALHLETFFANSKWASKGEITGNLRFGPAKSSMGALGELFNGVKLEFENLDLLNLASGDATIEITLPPTTFKFAQIMRVDLRGLKIGVGGGKGEGKSSVPGRFQLLGDITLEQLPGVNSSLTFGGITLIPGPKPSFAVSRIGGRLSTPGGFAMDGMLEHIENNVETGFVGSFGMQMGSFPRINGVVKLTKITAGDGLPVPSLALFLETDFDAALFAGFFLRRIGAGLGLRQGLRGLAPKPGESLKPLPQRILALVDDAGGLPEPRRIDSWVPVRPDKQSDPLAWTFVATGLITFGKLPPSEPHTFAGSLLLSIDHRLEIVMAMNAWLFTSPEETLRPEFQAKPVVRGAAALSIRDRRLFAYFKTLRDPKIGSKAPPLLLDILKNGDTSLMLSVDRDGFLLEVGWPWETRFGFTYGPLTGSLLAGARFGVHRGVLTFGLNYAIEVRLDASQELSAGPASAKLSVTGTGYFRTQFVGAVTRDFRVYLLGDVALGATVRLAIELSWEIRVDIGWKTISKTFRKSAALTISIHAALTAASNGVEYGFVGAADVSISVCGFDVSGRVGIGFNDSLVNHVRQELEDLKPERASAQPANAGITPPFSTHWNYRTYRLAANPGRLRVVFFPSPGNAYPGLDDGELPASRFKLTLKDPGRFKGIVGSVDLAEGTALAQWSERFEAVLIDEEQALEGLSSTEVKELRDQDTEGKLRSETMEDVLRLQSKLAKVIPSGRPGSEIRDERTRRDGSYRSDDVTQAIGEEDVHSPNLPADSTYDKSVSDACANATADRQRVVRSGLTRLRLMLPLDAGPADIQSAMKKQAAKEAWAILAGQIDPMPVAGLTQAWYWPGANVFALRPDATQQLVVIEEGPTPALVTTILDAWSVQTMDAPVPASNERLDVLKAVGVVPITDGVEQLSVSRIHRAGGPGLLWEFEFQKADVTHTHLTLVDSQDRIVSEPEIGGYQRPLEPGLMLAELLEFMRDPRVQPQQVPSPDVLRDYSMAPYLQLVLEFDVGGMPHLNEPRYDPVHDLIDLEIDKTSFVGESLRPVMEPTREGLPEYDLVIENEFQSRDRICLAWDIVFEESSQAAMDDDPYAVYQELERYVVSRVHRSGESLEPKITTLYPAWLKNNTSGGDSERIRPQFQFVDVDVAAILDGHLVDYRVEAWSTDRRLSKTEFTVTRRIVEPLPAVAQPLAIQQVVLADEKIDTTYFVYAVVDLPTKEDSNADVPLEQQAPDQVADQLTLCYRWVPCGTVGSYAFDEPRTSEASFETPISNEVSIRFQEAPHARPLPWSETRVCPTWDDGEVPNELVNQVLRSTWEPIVLEPTGPGTAAEKFLRFKARVTPPASWPVGKALELHLGRQIVRTAVGNPLRRSPLSRCQHGVIPRNWVDADAFEVAGQLNLKAGNNVAAFEQLPQSQEREILPDWIRHKVTYPEIQGVPTRINLEWLHELSGRGGFDRPIDAAGFNPVVGYELGHFDLLAPEHYDRAGRLRVRNITWQSLFVMPDTIYRATPSTVVVQGLKTEFAQPNPGAALNEVVSARLAVGAGSFAPVAGNWKPIRATSAPFPPLTAEEAAAPPQLVNVAEEQRNDEPHIEWPGGPVWLQLELQATLSAILSHLDDEAGLPRPCRCQLVLSRPLVDRIPDIRLSEGIDVLKRELGERFARLQSELDVAHDPYGWHSAEALGRSCECLFFDGRNRPIRAETIHQMFDAVKAHIGKHIALCLFVGSDSRTPLNVTRFVFAERPHNDLLVRRALILQVLGRLWAEFWAAPVPVAPADPVTLLNAECERLLLESSWLKDQVVDRLQSVQCVESAAGSTFAAITQFQEDPRYASDNTTTHLPRVSPWHPIETDGRIRHEIDARDEWGHEDCFALRPIRRYDLLRKSIEAPQSTLPEPVQADGKQTPAGWTRVCVDRTQRLVPPKLISSPLPAGVQFIVLRHPAEFASNATADNEARIQFGGVLVHWMQRRVPKGVLDNLETLKTGPKADLKPMDWAAFVLKVEGDNPKIPLGFEHQFLHQTFPGTDVGIFGADRHIAPDVPPYYEYRTFCSVTAGRAFAASEYSAWVQPIVESHATSKRQLPWPIKEHDVPYSLSEPQVPRVRPVHEVDLTNDERLRVDISVSLLRDLLTPEFRSIWSPSEETRTFGDSSIKVGSLPDVAMVYQLYFRTDPIIDLEKPERQELMPLARVKLKPIADAVPIEVKLQPPGVAVTDADCELVQAGDQGLCLRVHFRFDSVDPLGRRFLDQAKSVKSLMLEGDELGLRRLIAVRGERNGALSKIMEAYEEVPL